GPGSFCLSIRISAASSFSESRMSYSGWKAASTQWPRGHPEGLRDAQRRVRTQWGTMGVCGSEGTPARAGMLQTSLQPVLESDLVGPLQFQHFPGFVRRGGCERQLTQDADHLGDEIRVGLRELA